MTGSFIQSGPQDFDLDAREAQVAGNPRILPLGAEEFTEEAKRLVAQTSAQVEAIDKSEIPAIFRTMFKHPGLYADTLIGARFAGHPMSPQFQDARIKVEAGSSPLAKGLPLEWTMNDEWYSFSINPRKAGASVLATLDETTYLLKGLAGEDLQMGDHPIAWSNCVGKGKMFHSAIGHRPETYFSPEYRTMLENALGWVSQRRACKTGH